MKKPQDLSFSFVVDRTPEEVFAAIKNVRGWWSGQITGDTEELGAAFTYRHGDEHRSRQTVTELVPARRVVWHVSDSHLSFLDEKDEWNGTDIVFDVSEKKGKTEVRFTHQGLKPEVECYDVCSNAWGVLFNGNLRNLILTGKPQPDPFV